MAEDTRSSTGKERPPAAHVPAPAPPVRVRRRVLTIAAAVTLIVVGTLASYIAFQSVGNSVAVFGTAGTVLRGDVIDATDLTEIHIAADQQVETYPVEEASALIGRYASVDLPPGSMLTVHNTADSLGVPEGQSLVGVPLRPGQMPAGPIVAGDRVRLVATALPDPAGRVSPDAPAAPTDAVVARVVPNVSTELTIVDVLVPTTSAADLAARAAAGTLALILDPAG